MPQMPSIAKNLLLYVRNWRREMRTVRSAHVLVCGPIFILRIGLFKTAEQMSSSTSTMPPEARPPR